ncbi:MAG: Rv0361 family membrane protein [Aeromicrobium sp.]
MNSLPNRVLAGVVAGIVVLAVVAAVFASTRQSATLDRGSPERAVQAFLKAALDRDNEKAATYFAPGSSCDAEDLDRAYVQEDAQVELVDSKIDGDSARVDVNVTFSSGGPFPGYGERHTFRLTRTGDVWLLNGIPWPLFDCEGSVK